MKSIERLIICVLLILVAYAMAGCKEKAEAKEPNDPNYPNEITITVSDSNDIILWDDEIYLELILRDEPNFADDDRIYVYQGDEFDIVIEKKEPNETAVGGLDKDRYWIYPDIEIEPKKYSLPIPTWPDFIELDRDLVIKDWVIEKGTKIYFKD